MTTHLNFFIKYKLKLANIAWQLDCSDFNFEIYLIHPAKLLRVRRSERDVTKM